MVAEALPNEKAWRLLTKAVERCAGRKLFFSMFYEHGHWSAMAGPADDMNDVPETLVLVNGTSMAPVLEQFLLSLVKLEREHGWRS